MRLLFHPFAHFVTVAWPCILTFDQSNTKPYEIIPRSRFASMLLGIIFTQCSTPKSISCVNDRTEKIKLVPVKERGEESILTSDLYSSPTSGNGSEVKETFSSPAPIDEVFVSQCS